MQNPLTSPPVTHPSSQTPSLSPSSPPHVLSHDQNVDPTADTDNENSFNYDPTYLTNESPFPMMDLSGTHEAEDGPFGVGVGVSTDALMAGMTERMMAEIKESSSRVENEHLDRSISISDSPTHSDPSRTLSPPPLSRSEQHQQQHVVQNTNDEQRSPGTALSHAQSTPISHASTDNGMGIITNGTVIPNPSYLIPHGNYHPQGISSAQLLPQTALNDLATAADPQCLMAAAVAQSHASQRVIQEQIKRVDGDGNVNEFLNGNHEPPTSTSTSTSSKPARAVVRSSKKSNNETLNKNDRQQHAPGISLTAQGKKRMRAPGELLSDNNPPDWSNLDTDC